METWHRANVDFCEGMYDGIRSSNPLLSDASDRGDIRTIATSARNSTWGPYGNSRYVENQIEERISGTGDSTIGGVRVRRIGLEIAAQRYIDHSDTKTRTGAESNDDMQDESSTMMETAGTRATRVYPAGKRLRKGESTRARFHSPQDERGKKNLVGF